MVISGPSSLLFTVQILNIIANKLRELCYGTKNQRIVNGGCSATRSVQIRLSSESGHGTLRSDQNLGCYFEPIIEIRAFCVIMRLKNDCRACVLNGISFASTADFL